MLTAQKVIHESTNQVRGGGGYASGVKSIGQNNPIGGTCGIIIITFQSYSIVQRKNVRANEENSTEDTYIKSTKPCLVRSSWHFVLI